MSDIQEPEQRRVASYTLSKIKILLAGGAGASRTHSLRMFITTIFEGPETKPFDLWACSQAKVNLFTQKVKNIFLFMHFVMWAYICQESSLIG